MVCSHPPPNLVISIGNRCIFLREILAVTRVLNGITLRDEPVSTKAFLTWTSFIIVETYSGILWSGYWTSFIIAWASVVKQWDLDEDAIPTMASVAAVLASGVSPNWWNSEWNAGLLCNVLVAARVSVEGIMGSFSLSPACMTTTTIRFPVPCWGKGFLCTPWVPRPTLRVSFAN